MAKLPHERLYVLQHKIEQQRRTVEALKREGHEHTDAERQLAQMIVEAQTLDDSAKASAFDVVSLKLNGPSEARPT